MHSVSALRASKFVNSKIRQSVNARVTIWAEARGVKAVDAARPGRL